MAKWIQLSCLLAATAAQGGAPHLDPAKDAEHFGLPEALLFLQGKQKIATFRNIASIYPTRVIESGGNALPLPPAAEPVADVAYQVEGQTYDLNHYIDHNHVVGLVAVKDGAIHLERYAGGNTERSLWVSFSVAKSVVSMLLGAAIEDGYIASVDEPVSAYLPRLKGTSYDDVSIRHLLQMASGVAWNEDYADPTSDVNTMPSNLVELYEAIGAKERVGDAGKTFNYNTAETNLVGAVVRAAIGNNLATYLAHKVWMPFGMESPANWLTHGAGGGELGGCCISATVRDYARIGLFALGGGELPDGTRVLPKGWMQASIAPSEGFAGYGYLWWLAPNGSYSALGIFGQGIYVDPKRNVVVATHSAWPTATGAAFYQHREAFLEGLAAQLATR